MKSAGFQSVGLAQLMLSYVHNLNTNMKILVINHHKSYNAERFQPWLEEAGFEIDNRLGAIGQLPQHVYYSTDSLAHDHFAAMIVTGGGYNLDGSGGAWWLPHTGKLMREAIQQDMPVLGICLGGQLLAYTLGGQVDGCHCQIKSCTKPFEYGLTDIHLTQAGQDDPLFVGLGRDIIMHENHQAYIAELPNGAELLARSDRCPVEAFRYGQNAYGIQFHPEVAADTIDNWSQAKIQHLIEAGVDWPAIVARRNSSDVDANLTASRQICNNFANIVQNRAK